MTDAPEAPDKWFCKECDKVVFEHLSAKNPFDAGDTIYGCPHCKSVNSLFQACQYPGCEQIASGGHPNALGYRYAWLCYKHSLYKGETP